MCAKPAPPPPAPTPPPAPATVPVVRQDEGPQVVAAGAANQRTAAGTDTSLTGGGKPTAKQLLGA